MEKKQIKAKIMHIWWSRSGIFQFNYETVPHINFFSFMKQFEKTPAHIQKIIENESNKHKSYILTMTNGKEHVICPVVESLSIYHHNIDKYEILINWYHKESNKYMHSDHYYFTPSSDLVEEHRNFITSSESAIEFDLEKLIPI